MSNYNHDNWNTPQNYAPSFFNKQILHIHKQQGFKKLQIKQSEGFKILN